MSTQVTSADAYDVARRWQRYHLNVPVRVIVRKTIKTTLFDGTQRESTNVVVVNGRGTELNEGGMAVFAGIELSVGERVQVEFTPPRPPSRPLRVPAVVRDRLGYIYGVEFVPQTQADAAEVEALRDALRALGTPH